MRTAAFGALDAACHGPDDRRVVLLEEDWALVALTGRADYPFASFDFGDVAVWLEGRIYQERRSTPAGGSETIERGMRRLAEIAFHAEDADRRLAAWVGEQDGEFVAIAAERSTRRLVLVNDQLGRLPLYAARTRDRLLVSREVRFLTGLQPSVRFDAMGIAQHLLVGFPLGARTLIDGVERLPPATSIRVDAGARRIDVATAPPPNLAAEAEGRDPRAQAEELSHVFLEAVRARAARGSRNVVSLSGGADSRSVGAALHRERIPFHCVSFLDAAGTAAADVAVAERLATLFGADWRLLRLPPPTEDHRRRLLRLKSGFNPLSMAYLVPYLERVQAELGGDVVFFTGDGGDKVLPDLRGDAALDADGAVAAVVRAHALLTPGEIAALTGVGRADLLGALRQRIASHPEEEWPDRRAHFEVFERAFKWLFEGEDRNRTFFWSTTPFYAAPFFRAAMRCPPAHKAHRGLYRDFLLALSPAAAAVEYAGLGAAIDSDAFRIAAKAASVLARHAGRRPDGIATASGPLDAAAQTGADLLRAQRRRCEAIGAYLDPDALEAFLDGPAAGRPRALDALYTVASAIEELAR